MSDKYLSKQEAATILGVHERTIARYLHAGKLKGAMVGNAWRIAESDVKAFYEDLKAETAKNMISHRKQKGKQGD